MSHHHIPECGCDDLALDRPVHGEDDAAPRLVTAVQQLAAQHGEVVAEVALEIHLRVAVAPVDARLLIGVEQQLAQVELQPRLNLGRAELLLQRLPVALGAHRFAEGALRAPLHAPRTGCRGNGHNEIDENSRTGIAAHYGECWPSGTRFRARDRRCLGAPAQNDTRYLELII